ncbi:M14 metallopeptidase family protein [Pedobacter sp. Hv1]|uniref:M14 metallopeptidase family protein n=1 Tax=Pedobacter sp. Hv1 TaxID=1740090 RepID=UPI0006D8D6AC|nr:M14 metallopeptidase family protein [Pedobacter sp. Hv1]KQB99221.1 zinc carboxypeptidase [Pedobacter sp. Hv1]
MKRSLLCFVLLSVSFKLFAQTPSPDEFLGYPLGSHFTPHQKVVDYFKKVAATNKNIQLQTYGKTYEGRELLLAVVSDASNMAQLEQIRKYNVGLSNVDKSASKAAKQPAIVWLSYNVHGNEANSTETAMRVLYTLSEAKDSNTREWLKNTIVIIDPCLNPDGRERYVSNFNMVSGKVPNPDPTAREHSEPWPGGRPNHYYYDLNRDWAWQTQVETQQRLVAYHQWMPQVHVDFHEQSYNEPYYFAPAAEPVHQDITPWQREFQVVVGKNNAKYFDENGWQYFTKERFDLLYPSYGDTYPLYNGAVGMTYEQGGIRAGLAVVTADGDTLTLKDRIDHHFTTSMSTIETVSANAEKLVSEFKKYFEQSLSNPPGIYKTYIVKAQNIQRLRKMADLLKRNHIAFAFGGDRTLNGYNYETQKVENFKVERNDLIVNLQQSHSVMANVLFEPQTVVTDSNTYDITAWALPYAYGLNAYAVKEFITGSNNFIEEKKESIPNISKPYAWVIPWNTIDDAQTVVSLQKQKVKIRIADEAFTIGGKAYRAGSLLVYRTENEKINKDLSKLLTDIAKDHNVAFYPIASGYVEKGKDFGSSVYRLLSAPKIAVVSGQEVSSQGVGEVWHFLEQELNYPITMISVQSAAYLDINKINVLILPDGSYNEKLGEQLSGWISAGGKVILMEDAIGAVIGKRPFDIKKKEYPKKDEKETNERRYSEKDKDDLQNSIPGAIYKVSIDQSHPLALGLGKYYYTLKTDEKIYEPLENGWNVGVLKANSYMAGVAGDKVKKKLAAGLLYGVQQSGRGTIVYLGTDVLFRSFWENGKQLFTNALFLVN